MPADAGAAARAPRGGGGGGLLRAWPRAGRGRRTSTVTTASAIAQRRSAHDMPYDERVRRGRAHRVGVQGRQPRRRRPGPTSDPASRPSTSRSSPVVRRRPSSAVASARLRALDHRQDRAGQGHPERAPGVRDGRADARRGAGLARRHRPQRRRADADEREGLPGAHEGEGRRQQGLAAVRRRRTTAAAPTAVISAEPITIGGRGPVRPTMRPTGRESRKNATGKGRMWQARQPSAESPWMFCTKSGTRNSTA